MPCNVVQFYSDHTRNIQTIQVDFHYYFGNVSHKSKLYHIEHKVAVVSDILPDIGTIQGDNLSPTLFSMFLNDLATGIKELNLGVDVDGCNVSILLYADDIVLIAPNENNLQCMLDYVKDCCKKWRMSVNRDKTQVVHFRPVRTQPTAVQFWFDGETLDTVSSYKYLGIYLDEHLSFKATVNALSASASRALGYLRYKLRFLKECRCATFTRLYSSCVCPIMDYASGVWGVKSFDCLEQVQYRALRYFLGVHKFTPIYVLTGDSGWLSCFSRHKLALEPPSYPTGHPTN